MADQTKSGKLVRDGIPQIIRDHGGDSVATILDEVDYRVALRAKLREEVDELLTAPSADVPEEVADVLEVLRSLAAVTGTSWEEVEDLRARKRMERGGFDQRVWLDSW